MASFLGSGLYFAYNLLFFMLFFWIWIPGMLASAILTLRYRQRAVERLVQRRGSPLWAALLLGMTSSPQRKASLQTARILLATGVSPLGVLAFLIASHTLVLYFLAVLTLLLGIEFAVGQALAGLLMLLLVAGVLPLLLSIPSARQHEAAPSPADALLLLMAGYPAPLPWSTVLFTPRGWREILKYIGREFQRIGLSTLVGIFLGGFVLAGGLQPWWVDVADFGGEDCPPTSSMSCLLLCWPASSRSPRLATFPLPWPFSRRMC